jgi:hypothetical protein
MGLDRKAFGVYDREGGHSTKDYPFARGMSYFIQWANFQPSKNVFNFDGLNALAALADKQNQVFIIQVGPIGGSVNASMPDWIFAEGVPKLTDGVYFYGFYLDPLYKTFFRQMVEELAAHVRKEMPLQFVRRLAFARVDTGATGDEGPYEEPTNVPVTYQITESQWRDFRLWVFEVYRAAFQDGPEPPVKLLFQDMNSQGIL